MSFDNLFRQPIPLQDASDFFVGLKKQAEWTDPPDMTGQLEGAFSVPVEQVLSKLKDVITTKYRLMVAYYTYAQSFQEHAWRALKIEFYEHACDEQEGAEFYTKRAVALGGPVHMDEILPPPATTNGKAILRIMARAEQEGIAAQRELRAMVGDENPMKIGIEEHMLKDQHHLDEIWQMMPPEERQALEAGPLPPAPEEMSQEEMPPEAVEEAPAEVVPEEEPPIEEKAASMRLDVVLEKAAADKRSPETVRRAKQRGIGRVAGLIGGAGLGAAAGYGGGRLIGKALGGPGGTSVGGGLGAAVGMVGGMRGGTEAGRAIVAKLQGPPPSKRKKAELKKEAKDYTDEELKETGRQRGVASLAAEATREKGRRGERAGKVLGTIAGGLGGAAAGKKFIGGKAGTIAGLASGMLAGRSAGKELGTERDLRKNAAAMRFDLVLHKLAFDEDPQAMAAPTAGDMQPTNYLAAEMLGQRAQEANEANFYREQLSQAKQESAAVQQQMADTQMQLDQLQQQAAQAGTQVQQAAQEAMAARDDAVNATLEVAKARIGAQKMRQQMLELASQDPQALGEEAVAPQMAMGPDGQPMPPEAAGAPPEEAGAPDAGMAPPPEEEGPAGGAPAPPTPPGAAPPAGGPDMAAPAAGPMGPPPEGGMPATELKQASARLLGALGGAALGAGSGALAGRSAPGLRDRVQQLEASQDGSFGQAAALAAAKKGLAAGELAEKHPMGSAIMGGLGGAVTGAMAGPMLAQNVSELGEHGRIIGRAIRRGVGG